MARTTRRLAATEQGLQMAERARAVLAEYDAMTSSVAAVPVQGLLRLTAPVQFGRLHVAPLVASFLDAYPAVRVELVLNDRDLDLIEEGLDLRDPHRRSAQLDVAGARVGEVRRYSSPARTTWRRAGRRGRPRTLLVTTRSSERHDPARLNGGSERPGMAR